MTLQTLYHLGCPAWRIAEWRGNFFPAGARPADFLQLYSSVFNSVEGNSTFYGLPKLETAKRWAREVVPGFEFCFKVPRDISHGHRLTGRPDVFSDFMKLLEVVADGSALGPTFLQLHSSFGPERFSELEAFCVNWPKSMPLAVEVRHPAFFADAKSLDANKRLDSFLTEQCIDRVIFDSRALFHAPPDDNAEIKSQGRKPKLSVFWNSTGKRPMLRFVGRNQIEKADPWLKIAAKSVANWIEAGKHPYVFMHTPDDTLAPQLCERFHQTLRAHLQSIPELKIPQHDNNSQLELF